MKKKTPNENMDNIEDPLSGLSDSDIPALKRAAKKKSPKKTNVVRIDELRERLARGEGLDDDEVLSTYIPQRRARLFGKAILRLDKLRLFILIAVLIIAILFIMAMMQEKMGNFTINLDRLEMFRKGIAMSSDAEFTQPTARLMADVVKDATNISINDLPDNLDDIDGGHNGNNYMAYTYYVRNAGKEAVSYSAILTLDKCSKGAEKAVRVAVWYNGKRTVYAMPANEDQDPEKGCVNFINEKVVMNITEDNFEVGNVDKFTVVIWMEGDDDDCVDSIIGGAVEFSMKLVSTNENDTSLFQKFVQDIIDTIKGDKPIGAAGNESPDYYKWKDVTWANRKNQNSMYNPDNDKKPDNNIINPNDPENESDTPTQ